MPAAACAALAAMLVLQLAVPRAVTLPEPGVVRPFALDPARPVALAPDPAILARPLFARAAAGAAAVTEGPVGGAHAIGVVVRGRARTGFVQASDGSVAALAPGAAYRGWRLVVVGANALVFRRGAETATLPVTAGARATATPAPPTPPAGAAPQ